MKLTSTKSQLANSDVPLDWPMDSSMSEDYSLDTGLQTTRSRALISTAVESIQSLDAKGIFTLQCILQHGLKFGFWHTPEKWSPLQVDATMNINLRKRIINFLPTVQQQLVKDSNETRNLMLTLPSAEVITLPSTTYLIESILDEAVLTATRYLVLCRMGPAGISRNTANRPMDPSNLRQIGYAALPALLAVGVSKRLDYAKGTSSDIDFNLVKSPSPLGLLQLVQNKDLMRFSLYLQDSMAVELRRLRMLQDKGLWSDMSAPEQNSSKITDVSGNAMPPPTPRVTDKHQPLPDDYVSEMGSKSVWIIENLGPNLLTIGEEILEIWKRTDKPELKPSQVRLQRTNQLKKYILNFTWRDGSGALFSELPFMLGLCKVGSNSNKRRNKAKQRAALELTDEYDLDDLAASSMVGDNGDPLEIIPWPPKNVVHINGLMGALQTAHLFVVALSMGSRKSEVLTLKRSCVEYAKNGEAYANGRTYKLVERHDGVLRDWVLPDVAVQAIKQQIRLVVLSETIGPHTPKRNPDGTTLAQAKPGTHLWGRISGTGKTGLHLTNINSTLVMYAQALGMNTDPGGQRLRSHRFRKTLARIVALALTEAPKVLMNVFGHKSIEMTLYYILTDKDLQADIEQVSRELRVMRALHTVQAIVDAEDAQDALLNVATSAGMPPDPSARLVLAGYGGPAAEMVSNAIKVQKERLHTKGDEWGTEHARELAMILTLNGKAWQLVRTGVICTKFPGTESGPCNYSVGKPEPSRCRTSCSHRLEEGFLRDDVDGSIKDAVEAYKDAGDQGEDLTQEFWVGQILGHLRRFDDLHHKWIQDPTVKKLVNDAQRKSSDAVTS